jgi:citronellol/citronellal dehydrogenase
MNSFCFKKHVAYTMYAYGHSMCVLGMAEGFREKGIAVNALWPRTGK